MPFAGIRGRAETTRKWGAAPRAQKLRSSRMPTHRRRTSPMPALGGTIVRDRSARSHATAPSSGGPEAEQRLSEFYAAVVDAGQPLWRHALRHPRAALAAAQETRHLPLRDALLGDSLAGRAIHATLGRPGP